MEERTGSNMTEKKPTEFIMRMEPSGDFTKVYGKSFIKSTLSACKDEELNRAFGCTSVQGFLFCGPHGTGKHYIAEAFAGEMQKKHYTCLKIDFKDFQQERQGMEKEVLETLFQPGLKKEKCFLIFENMDQARETDFLARCLSDFQASEASLIYIAYSEQESQIPVGLRKRFCVLMFACPDKEDRMEYFQNSLKRIIRNASDFEAEWFVEKTKEMDYNQLESILEVLRLSLKVSALKKYGTDKAELKAKIISGEFRLEKKLCEKAVMSVRIPEESISENEGRHSIPPVQVVMPPMQNGYPMPMPLDMSLLYQERRPLDKYPSYDALDKQSKQNVEYVEPKPEANEQPVNKPVENKPKKKNTDENIRSKRLRSLSPSKWD